MSSREPEHKLYNFEIYEMFTNCDGAEMCSKCVLNRQSVDSANICSLLCETLMDKCTEIANKLLTD